MMMRKKSKLSCGKNSFLEAIAFLSFLFIPLSADHNPSYYIPTDNFAFDCSPPTPSSDLDFGPNSRLKFGASSTVSRVYAIDPITRSNPDQKPKVSACVWKEQFSLPVVVSNGPKFLRLHFKLISYSGLSPSDALFSVTVDNHTLLTTSPLSYPKDVSSVDYYVVKEFCLNVYRQMLNLTFTPLQNTSSDAYAFVNKVEVTSMPSNLYIQQHIPLPIIGSHSSSYSMEESTALETMYRFNVGGNFITEQEDSGMFRNWANDDQDYLASSDGRTANMVSLQGRVNLSLLLPMYTAPSQVYTSALAIDQPTSESKLMATWSFPVDYGFRYLVRFHFCEISDARMRGEGQRAIHIFVDNQTAEDHADVFQWSNGAGIPVHKDYIVNFSKQGEGIKNLSIAIGSSINGSFSRNGDSILNGLEIFKLSDSSNNLAGSHPLSLGIGAQHSQHSKKYDEAARTILKLVSKLAQVVSLTLVAIGILGSYYWFFSTGFNRRSESYRQLSLFQCRVFSIPEIKSATDNFDETAVIGTGGFGKVYKGSIDGGRINVAIKRASSTSNQGLTEFETEISMLSKLRHSHLVSLIGYSKEEKEMILVYEYMAKGTLRDHLYNSQEPPLPWKQRLKICIGAARGLHYLHTGSKHTIIHRDIKSTNILLDEKWVAKVSDFGLSKVGPNATTQSRTHVSTIVKGTFGYLDPEYYRRQKLTEKSDVYSFGVVLFEVLCGRPAVGEIEIEEEEYDQKVSLAEWVLHCIQIGTLDQIVDPFLKGKISPESFKTFTSIASKCLVEKGSERPSMGNVLWNLELAMQQEEGCDKLQETSCVRMEDGFSVMIDGQHFINGFGNSDRTPGLEFSEIVAPLGR